MISPRIFFIILVFVMFPAGVHAQDSVRVLWQEPESNRLHVNNQFLSKSPEHIQAILAFLSTQAGSECRETQAEVIEVDMDDPNLLEFELNDLFAPSQLRCKLAENIGYEDQCSDEHVAFVKKWFRRDTAVFEELEKCFRGESIPSKNRFFSSIELLEKDEVVEVRYRITRTDSRLGAQETQEYVDRFELDYDVLLRTAHDPQ